MEVDIFDAIAKHQGFNVSYVPHNWEGIFNQLNEDEPVFVVSAVTMTDEAKANALLSDPYYISPYRVVADDPNKLETWQDLQIGISTNEDSLNDLPKRFHVTPNNLKTYNTVFAAVTGMIRGDVDVVVADSLPYYFIQ